jgi:hypothetical protein
VATPVSDEVSHAGRTTAARGESRPHQKLAASLAVTAILLRLASDWLFKHGGPGWFELAQALLLAAAVLALAPRLDLVYLKGGEVRQSIRTGLIALPLGVLAGVLVALAQHGTLKLPTLHQAVPVIAANLFFPAVEELEFRGFALSWALRRGMPAARAIWVIAAVHTLAHWHWFKNGSTGMLLASLLLFVWFGRIVLRTRSMYGAYVAHAAANITFFLLVDAPYGIQR